MSLARALTTRRKVKEEVPPPMPHIGRAASQRAPNAKPIKTSDISLPVALISTTNMLSYEAPDIANAPHAQRTGGRYVSSTASSRSSVPSAAGDDSDHAGSVHSRETDATSVDLSSPELSQDKDGYFTASSSPVSQRSALSPKRSYEMGSPRIPVRSASHSKNAHVLSHKASMSMRRAATTATRPVQAAAPAHPFSRELEQLTEAAEEFGQAVQSASRSAEADIDRSVMQAKGLLHFCASEYAEEIASLYSTTFAEDHSTHQPMVWI